jgi:5-(carboxyamino)imidazole ribonucleotide mutase
MKQISIIMGSKSDLNTVKETMKILDRFGVKFEVKVLSAHRTPQELTKYLRQAQADGVRLFIAAAGGAAALAGVIAAHTCLPVIGIPIETRSLKGLDSLLSTVQMPSGVPVGCMAIGKAGAKNAAFFALEILGIEDEQIQSRLLAYRKETGRNIKKIKIRP